MVWLNVFTSNSKLHSRHNLSLIIGQTQFHLYYLEFKLPLNKTLVAVQLSSCIALHFAYHAGSFFNHVNISYQTMYKNSDLHHLGLVTIVQYMLIQTSPLGNVLFYMMLFVSHFNLLTVIHKNLLVK